MTTREMTLAQWLRDAHAMEMQSLEILESQADRLEHYPDLRTRIRQHYEETREQERKIRSCLERHGGRSFTKDIAARLTAMAQDLSGMVTSDEVVKGAVASYTFEHFEISAYKVLISAAEDVGDAETKQACEEILREEERMAEWLSDHLPQLAREYLAREGAGTNAKR